MAWATLRSLVAGLFRRQRVEADMAAEIEFHIETFGSDAFETDSPVLEAFIAETQLAV